MSLSAEDRKEPVLDTPESMLKDAVLRCEKLDTESQEALSQGAAKCKQKLVERAKTYS